MDKALSRIQIPCSYRLHKVWRGFGFEPTVTLTVLKQTKKKSRTESFIFPHSFHVLMLPGHFVHASYTHHTSASSRNRTSADGAEQDPGRPSAAVPPLHPPRHSSDSRCHFPGESHELNELMATWSLETLTYCSETVHFYSADRETNRTGCLKRFLKAHFLEFWMYRDRGRKKAKTQVSLSENERE